VKLYSAVSKQTIRFRELREGDGSRIKHKRVAEEDGEEVPYEKIVKGYEVTPDQYIVMSKDELEEIDPKKTRAIEIKDFVDLDDIDPIYFEHPYYLGPDKGAEKAYALLAKAMRDERKVAIARFVLRNKEHLAAIRPLDDVLTLTTMRFADGVEPADGRKLEKRELDMAKELIASLSSDFDAEQYRDEYREELLALIERKAQGKKIAVQPSEEPTPTKAPDLMAALEESLASVRGEELGGAEAGDGAKAKKPAKPARSKAESSGSKAKSSGSKAKAKPKSSSKSRSKSASGGRRKSPAKSRS
jgi:DNA end-binding protein Ku